MAVFNDKGRKEFRRELRKNASRGEVVLWSGLRKIGVGAKFRRQESIDQFVVDFYCPEVGLAVEVDGVHHAHTKEYDAWRDGVLQEIGVRTLRFSDSEVISNSEKVLAEIRAVVEELQVKNGSYRRRTTQVHPDERSRLSAKHGANPTQPPPGPRLGKAGEID